MWHSAYPPQQAGDRSLPRRFALSTRQVLVLVLVISWSADAEYVHSSRGRWRENEQS